MSFGRLLKSARALYREQGPKAVAAQAARRLFGSSPAGEAAVEEAESPAHEPKDPKLIQAEAQITSLEPFRDEYLRRLATMQESNAQRGPNYVPRDDRAAAEAAVKLIAFYLPQFHPFPENDEWWGKGFTEWTNVSKAVPQFPHHYQPHLPDELGFYDLRVRQVQREQVRMARQYGIHGFAFYYYWFAGKRLLERPLDAFVSDPEIDFPFCMIWANENWTRRWDGHEDDILMAQDHSPEGDVAFIKDLETYLKHPNYMRVDGRPIVIVYRIDLLPEPKETAARWREYCLSAGLGNPYLIIAQTFGAEDPRKYGFDAAMQFPPHNEYQDHKFLIHYRQRQGVKPLNPEYDGAVFSYPAVVADKIQDSTPREYDLYESACPMWDNASRRPGGGITFAHSTPELYKLWLQALCRRAVQETDKMQKMVFLNAWNEWAESAHLEPDRRYGFGYLKATREALEYAGRFVGDAVQADAVVAQLVKTSDTAEFISAAERHFGYKVTEKWRSMAMRGEDDLRCRLAKVTDRIILVHSMGKVGSTSAYRALLKTPLAESTFHTHLLCNGEQIAKELAKRNVFPMDALYYIRAGEVIRSFLERRGQSLRVSYISGVRDPLARNVASFFDNLGELMPNARQRWEANDLGADELHQLFIHLGDNRAPEKWFQTQFQPLSGIDVYAQPFQCQAGYQLYSHGRSEAVVFRLEDLDRCGPEALPSFLGLESLPLARENQAEDKFYASLLREFRSKPMPEEFLDKIYGGEFANQFYTNEEISAFRAKWSGTMMEA